MGKHRIVIIGGGFGGIQTALKLSGDDRFAVTLVTNRPDFHYFPSLYRTATGGKRMISSIPLTEIFQGKPVHIILDEAVGIDREKRVVTTKVRHTIGYEAVVLSLGVQTNYFNIEGLKELSFGIKTPDDAEELKAHLHRQLIEEGKPDTNYVIVGGGPTGIELASSLVSYLKSMLKSHGLEHRTAHVDLVEAAPRLVPRMPKDISIMVRRRLRKLGIRLYLSTVVQAQTADALMVHDKAIRSHTVVWTAGVTNHPFFKDNAFQLTKSGKVRVDQYLQSEPGIYVIGDNADTPYSGMAQTALNDGAYVAENLKRVASHQDPKPYQAKKPIYVLPAGNGWAAVLWGKVRIYGRLGWILRSLADLVAYNDFEPWQLATRRWLALDDTEDACAMCIKSQI